MTTTRIRFVQDTGGVMLIMLREKDVILSEQMTASLVECNALQPHGAELESVEAAEITTFEGFIEQFEHEAIIIDDGWKSANLLIDSSRQSVIDVEDTVERSMAEIRNIRSGTDIIKDSRRLKRALKRDLARYSGLVVGFYANIARRAALEEVKKPGSGAAVLKKLDDVDQVPNGFFGAEGLDSFDELKGLTDQLSESIGSMMEQLYATFCEVEYHSRTVVAESAACIRDGGIFALRSFVEWLDSSIESQDGTYRSTRKAFAIDYHDEDADGMLIAAVDQATDTSHELLVDEFTQQVFYDAEHPLYTEVHQWLQLFQKAASRDGTEVSIEDIRQVFLGSSDVWPAVMSEQYEQYISSVNAEIRTKVHLLLGKCFDRSRLLPSDDRLIALDNHIRSMYTRTENVTGRSIKTRTARSKSAKSNRARKRKKGSTAKRSNGRVAKAELEMHPEIERQYVLGCIKNGPGFSIVEEGEDAAQSVQRIVQGFCKKYGENLDVQTINSWIATLISDPRGPGTKKLTDVTLASDDVSGKAAGKAYALYRFSPRRNPNAESVMDAQRIRIVYALKGDSVLVHQVLHHNDFDKLYTS